MRSFVYFLAVTAVMVLTAVFPAWLPYLTAAALVLLIPLYIVRILLSALYAMPTVAYMVIGNRWLVFIIPFLIVCSCLHPGWLWITYGGYVLCEIVQPWYQMLRARGSLYARLPKEEKSFSRWCRFMFSRRPVTVKTAAGAVICVLGTPESSEYRIDGDTVTVRRCVGVIPAMEREEYNPMAHLAARLMTGRPRPVSLLTEGPVHLLVHPYCALRLGDGDLFPGETHGRFSAIGKPTFFAMMKPDGECAE